MLVGTKEEDIMKKVSDLNLQKKGLQPKMAFAIQLVLLATTSMVANHTLASGCDFCLEPYVGVDAQMRKMHFQKHFGGNLLRHKYPQANFFGGVKFNEYLGIEGGYEVSKKQHTTKIPNQTDIIFGVRLRPVDPLVTNVQDLERASSKIYGWNLNLVGLLPIPCIEDCTQLLGSVGLAHLKLRVNSAFTSIGSVDLTPFGLGDLNNLLTNSQAFSTRFRKTKTVLRLSGGLQHKIIDCLGIRALVSWEKTSKLHTQGKNFPVDPTDILGVVKPKNSLQYSLGIFIPF